MKITISKSQWEEIGKKAGWDKSLVGGNYCGGLKSPKGHLDTQLFPECDKYETSRNVVKKTEDKRKKDKVKKGKSNA